MARRMSKPGEIAIGLSLVLLLLTANLFIRRVPDPSFAGRPASAWADDLASPDYATRQHAERAFEQLGAAGVPQLCAMLRRQDSVWNPYAARARRWLPKIALPRQDAAAIRRRGAETLAALGPAAAGAIPALVKALSDETLASDAERALARIGRFSHPELRQAVRTGRNAAIRARAAKLLREIPPWTSAAVEALVGATRDSHPDVRAACAAALGAAPANFSQISPALLALLADPEPIVRARAVQALGGRGDAEPPIRQAIAACLEDAAPIVRLEAARASWALTREAAPILSVLSELLETEHGWEAAYLLGRMRGEAAEAIPCLVRALRRERVPRPFRTPPSSVFALGQIGLAAVPALKEILRDPDPATRLGAAMAIGFIGADARPHAASLFPLLTDPNAEVRHNTALALGLIGTEAPEIISGLADCLRAEDIYMRSTAARLLQSLAPEGTWVVQPE